MFFEFIFFLKLRKKYYDNCIYFLKNFGGVGRWSGFFLVERKCFFINDLFYLLLLFGDYGYLIL